MNFRARNFRMVIEISKFAMVTMLIATPLVISTSVIAQTSPGPVKPGEQAPPTQSMPPVQTTPPAQATPAAQTPPPATSADGAQPLCRGKTCDADSSGWNKAAARATTIPSPRRNAKPGDPVYLETLATSSLIIRILMPFGSYVQGEIVSTKRPGKVKGTGEMQLRLNTMILPNGYTVNFNAIPSNAGTGGNESVDSEEISRAIPRTSPRTRGLF